MKVYVFQASAGRRPAEGYIEALPARQHDQVLKDLDLFRKFGLEAPVSKKPIAGHHGMFELRIGAHRLFYTLHGGTMVILGACKKQDQRREIEASAVRMRELRKETWQ